MGLSDLVRSGVALANSMTADLQASVTHKVYLSAADNRGGKNYSTIVRPAIVTKQQKLVKTASGEMKMSTAQIAFLDPAVVVNEHDLIFLPDGSGGPILNTTGFLDRGTGLPILTEVYLG